MGRGEHPCGREWGGGAAAGGEPGARGQGPEAHLGSMAPPRPRHLSSLHCSSAFVPTPLRGSLGVPDQLAGFTLGRGEKKRWGGKGSGSAASGCLLWARWFACYFVGGAWGAVRGVVGHLFSCGSHEFKECGCSQCVQSQENWRVGRRVGMVCTEPSPFLEKALEGSILLGGRESPSS